MVTLGLLVEMILGSAKCLVSRVGFGIAMGRNCFGTCGKAWLVGNLRKAGERLIGGIGLIFRGSPRKPFEPKLGIGLGADGN